jgi:quercetin dioxygenase-like cupin family protein
MVLVSMARTDHDVVVAQTRKPVVMSRIYTGSDGQTHTEEIDVRLTGNPLNEVSEMFKVTGAEVHRYPPGNVIDWHPAPRRQLVITLSGRGEVELAGGEKIALEPGHITRVVSNEERVTIQLPLADQSSR